MRFLAWSVFGLALSLPLTALLWSRNEPRPAPQTIVVRSASPTPPHQAVPNYGGVPVRFTDAVTYPRSDGAEVKFTVSCDALVTLTVFGPSSEVVCSLGSARVPSGVSQTAFWDGSDDSGRPARLRHYVLRMSAQAGKATHVIMKPFDFPNRQDGR